MKKIKINEQQANLLKNMDKTKVLKVTQEQYNRILETERLVEADLNESIGSEFSKALPAAAEKEFKNTKVPGIKNESYETFINELYGMNEGTEKKYDKLSKLMEVAGLINNGRLVKEKFQGNKDIVRGVISAGLDEMCEGGNEYKAMEIMEEVLDLSKDYKDGEDLFKAKVEEFITKYGNSYDREVRNVINTVKLKYSEGNYKEAWRASRISGKSMMEEGAMPKGISGNDILKYEPMSQLKKNRRDKGTEVRTINLPSTDSLDGYRTIHSQSEFTGYNIESSVGKTIAFKGYIQKFKERFNEEPIFEVTPNSTLDFDVINPIYVEARDKYKSDMGKAMDSDPGLANEEEVDETTVAGSASTGGSSGPFVGGGALSMKPENDSNVVDELINDEVMDVETDTNNILTTVVNELSNIVNSPSLNPNIIDKKSNEINQKLELLNNIEDGEKTIMFSYMLPDMFKKLIMYSKNIHKSVMFERYIHHIKYVFNTLKKLKEDINSEPLMYEELNEQGIGNSGQYDTPGFEDVNMKGDTLTGSGPTHKNTSYAGGSMVKIKDKCSKYPYCNQGTDAMAESIAKKTGRDIEEVKQIIENFNQK